MRITFHGAAGTVTGSCFLVEDRSIRFLVDCGMFQGGKELRERNFVPFPFEPASLDAVLLTHAHIDHSGLIPKLCREGFSGPIHTTRATTDLAGIVLPDSGHIQETEAEWQNRKRLRSGAKPVEPLYTANDAFAALKQFKGVSYGEPISIGHLRIRFRDAGHILGSASIDIESEGPGGISVRFSGDLGQTGQPIIRDPALGGRMDILIMESTYGGRRHEERAERVDLLRRAIQETAAAGGNIVIPSFAVGRTQELLYYLKGLLDRREVPRIPVFIDSPMAVSATEIFRRHVDCYDRETLAMLSNEGSPFEFDGLHMVRTSEESKLLNQRQGPAVIISSSGMCEAGRVLHHLKHNLWRPESTVLFVGYQGQGTLGRRILDGEKEVRILGEEIAVRARIRAIDGFSAHADEDGIMEWIRGFDSPPGQVFLVHGEEQAQTALSNRMAGQMNLSVTIPQRGESYELAADRSPLLTHEGHPKTTDLGHLYARIDRAWSALRRKWGEEADALPFGILEHLARELEQFLDQPEPERVHTDKAG